LFLVALALGASAATLRGDDALDRQYLARREPIDDEAALGLLGYAKKLEKKGNTDRAKFLCGVVLELEAPARKKEAQALLDRIGSRADPGSDSEVETSIDDWVKRQTKHYELIKTYCEKRNLGAEVADVEKRLASVAKVATGGAAPPPAADPKGAPPAAAPAKGATDEDSIVERVNFYRKNAGLPPVTLDVELSKGCKAHCNYLVKNDGKAEVQGLKAHNEDMALPGSTSAGSKAGRSSDIAWGSGAAGSVDAWMASLYHRIPILRPELTKVGAGYMAGTQYGNVCVLDVLTHLEGDQGPREVLYPADNLTGVPLRFGNETPDPVPAGGKPAGFSITCTGFHESELEAAGATLEKGSSAVACHLSTPQKPAANWPQDNTICLIPKSPLEAGATYKATFTFTKDGTKVTKVVTFTTAR
jgi:uncharacterized protein YkwD